MVSLISVANLLNAAITGIRTRGSNIPDIIKDEKRRGLLLTGGDIDVLLGDTIVTPTIVVDESLRGSSQLDDIIKLHVEMFVSKYTAGLKYLTEVNGVELDTSLRLLSTHKDNRMNNITNAVLFSPESEGFECLPIGKSEISNEAGRPGEISVTNYDFVVKYTKKIGGKYNEGEKDAEITITCRTLVKYAHIDEIVSLYEAVDPSKTSLGAQLERVFLGLSGFVSDLMFSQNLIDDHKKRRLKAKANLIKDLENRTAHARNQLLRDGAYGFGAYFNMFIINARSEKSFAARLGMPIEKGRTKLLELIKSMSIAFVDEEYETFDVHSKHFSTTITFKQIKSSKSSEIGELIKYMVQRGI